MEKQTEVKMKKGMVPDGYEHTAGAFERAIA